MTEAVVGHDDTAPEVIPPPQDETGPNLFEPAKRGAKKAAKSDEAMPPPPDGDIADPEMPLTQIKALAEDRLEQAALPATSLQDKSGLDSETLRTIDAVTSHIMTAAGVALDASIVEITTRAITTMSAIQGSWDSALRILAHQTNGMHALAEQVTGVTPVTPYAVTIACVSPTGYPMTFTVQERTQGAFLEALGGMLDFLKANQFIPQERVAF